MDCVDRSAHQRVVCRVCGTIVAAGEPRYGREEGRAGARRLQWRHLACAARTRPSALLRALERGGWRVVPEHDQAELRELIEQHRSPRRGPALPRAPGQDRAELTADESSATAAAHDPAGRSGPWSRARAWVYADLLQVRGDARGELLALELALERSGDPLEARALQREHHRLFAIVRARARLSATRDVRLRWRGGFLLGGHPRSPHELHRLLASPAAASLSRVQVEFSTREELARLVDAARTHRCPIAHLALDHARSPDLRALAQLEHLDSLRVSERFQPGLLRLLPRLRSLAVARLHQFDGAELEPLAARLQRLTLIDTGVTVMHELGSRLPALTELSLAGAIQVDARAGWLAAERLTCLRLAHAPVTEREPLLGLPRLRELALIPGEPRVVDDLAQLRGLERLALTGSGAASLEPLRSLHRCHHLALLTTRARQLEPLAELPRLRSLTLSGGDLRRVDGLARLVGLERLVLRKLDNVDLAQLTGLPRLRALVLDPDGRRPRGLDRLCELASLRRLSVPAELLAGLDAPARLLARVEVLELTGARVPSPAQIAALPRLRRLSLPNADPQQAAQLADAVPEVAVHTEIAPHDSLDRRDPFDWRSVDYPCADPPTS